MSKKKKRIPLLIVAVLIFFWGGFMILHHSVSLSPEEEAYRHYINGITTGSLYTELEVRHPNSIKERDVQQIYDDIYKIKDNPSFADEQELILTLISLTEKYVDTPEELSTLNTLRDSIKSMPHPTQHIDLQTAQQNYVVGVNTGMLVFLVEFIHSYGMISEEDWKNQVQELDRYMSHVEFSSDERAAFCDTLFSYITQLLDFDMDSVGFLEDLEEI